MRSDDDPVAQYSNFKYDVENVDKLGFPPMLRDMNLFQNKWYDPYSWRPEYKWSGLMGVIGALGQFYGNRAKKRSPFHALLPNLVLVPSVMVLTYFSVKYGQRLQIRDQAILDHYIELHPDDFQHLLQDNQKRKFKDILMPWQPNRSINFPKKPRPVLDEEPKVIN